MKRSKVKLGVLMLSVLVACFVCFAFSTAHAQAMNIWIGKWFKVTTKYSVYCTNALGGLSPCKAKPEVSYLNILNVDEDTNVVNSLNYSYEGGVWQSESTSWSYTGGNSLDFLCYYSICEGPADGLYCFGFTGRIKGKMKKGVLTSATIKSLGGFEWNVSNDVSNPSSAAGVTVTGSLIPMSKLPPDILK